MALHHSEADIDSCLAYEVLRNPDQWIGGPSTYYLSAFLGGVMRRVGIVDCEIQFWRISGVLYEQNFYKEIVNETGKPDLSINWVDGIAISTFSLTGGFEKLKTKALAWHRKYGVSNGGKKKGDSLLCGELVSSSWSDLNKRTGLWCHGTEGWNLYCHLSGFVNGGDWLGLQQVPFFNEVFDQMKRRSKEKYGSEFGAFRLYDSKRLLEWVDVDEKAFE